MAVTLQEIVRAGEKDNEYRTVKKAMLKGFPEKLKECLPIIQPFHKSRLNLSIVKEGDNEVVVYYDSDLRSRLLIPKLLRN